MRDAQGNIIAVYKVDEAANASAGTLKLAEHHVYGSSRLGIFNRDLDAGQPKHAADNANNNLGAAYLINFARGNKFFELTNHLGNVMGVISDKKLPETFASTPLEVTSYSTDNISYMDYSPFGMALPGRIYNNQWLKYRYGFNGKDMPSEMMGPYNEYDYGMRVYDPRVGRFLSVDPLTRDYAFYSPYQYAGNKPIKFTDLDGLEENGNSTDVKIKLMPLPVVPNTKNIIPVPKAYYFIADTRTEEQRQNAIKAAEHKKTMTRMYNSPEGWSFRLVTGIGQASTVVIPEAAAAKAIGDAAMEDEVNINKLIAAGASYGQLSRVRILNNTYQAVSRVNAQTTNKNLATLGEFDDQASRTFNTVKNGTLPGSQGAYLGGSRLTDEQMQSLSDLYKVEFAQIYTAGAGRNRAGGYYTLYSGTRTSVDVPVGPNIFLINHTHPGGTLSPSIFDIKYLKKAQNTGSPQRSSSIIPSGGKTFRFNENTEANGTE